MATWGLFSCFDEAAANTRWRPALEAGPDALRARLRETVPDLDAEALDEVDEAELSRLVFTEVAVVADSPTVPFAKHSGAAGLVAVLARRYGAAGPARLLEAAVRDRQTDAGELVALPRSTWLEVWQALVALDPALEPASADEVRRRQEAVQPETPDFTLAALGFIGWVLERTPSSLAMSIDALPMAPRRVQGPPQLAVLRDALLEAGLPVWEHFDVEAQQVWWMKTIDGSTSRAHAIVDLTGRQSYVRWVKSSLFRRLLGDDDIISRGGVEGPCDDASCSGCRAARFVSARLITPRPR
jgi:hypothetical protein